MKDPELARGPSFISDLGRTNREERSDGSRHPGPPNRGAQRRISSRVLIQKFLDAHLVDVFGTVFVINLLTNVRKTELPHQAH